MSSILGTGFCAVANGINLFSSTFNFKAVTKVEVRSISEVVNETSRIEYILIYIKWITDSELEVFGSINLQN